MKKITKDQMIASVKRELAMRKRNYPKWVAAGKMKQDAADHEVACMQAIFNTLKALEVPEVNLADGTDKRLYKAFLSEYDAFCRDAIGVGAKMDVYEEEALEKIIDYLREQATDKTDEGLITAWKFIFRHWDRVGDFIGKQKSLGQIYRNIMEILDKIRNGHDKKSAAKNQRDRTKASIAERQRKRAGAGDAQP